jgi:DMATS type aromatic prenyltransferase
MPVLERCQEAPSEMVRRLTTYQQISRRQLQELCLALGLDSQMRDYVAVQSFLLDCWGDREVPPLAPFPSRIGDDHSPYEYSVQFARDSIEVRLLLEAQAGMPGLGPNQQAALALTDKISQRYGVDTSRFRLIQDLFCPEDPHGPFSLWHAACLDRQGQPAFKIYLNPQVHGGVIPPGDLIAEAASRLGVSRQMQPVLKTVMRAGGVPNYFSLDLAPRLGMRTKLYFSHQDTDARTLEAIFSLCPRHLAGDVINFCEAMVGHSGALTKKPVCYCFSFVEGAEAPIAVTLHLPVAHYLESDALVLHHVSSFMAKHGMPVREYQRAITGVARRALGAGVGLQSYASYRREQNGMKLTVYLSPELFCGLSSQFPPPYAGLQSGAG